MDKIEKIIKNTNEKNQEKVNWTKAWSTKYKVLKTYQKEVNIQKKLERYLISYKKNMVIVS